ncbi:MAG: FtsQ-type POTRA domain-containing protein [Deltaproteobacteria bacterium]|nr:FtsQ-type POTRA domain-containing protein [Deltaproteobacteria bacterium]MBW2571676.1 FtsQ-type POTRA domain-containing protein [Deltaproteobacteria bacterium]MBW2669162.1 FtsQ-type POTRA domain-containing protein [Deltaproteobacteria bacterium]
MGRKSTRKNYYRNSAARRRNRIIMRVIFSIKTATVGTILLLASFLFIFTYDFITQCDYFKAESLTVTGANRLTDEQVLLQSQITEGVNILSVNLSRVRKRLLAHSWIEEAEVSRELPTGISIRIKEQQPLAVLDLGRKFIINTHGEIFKEMDASDHCRLPVIGGLEFSDINVRGESRSVPFNAVMTILALGKKPESVLPCRLIKRIRVDREMGLTIYAFDRIKAIKIGYDDYPNKYEMLKNVLFYLKKNGNFSHLESIDLNNLNRIVVNPARIGSEAGGHKEV